MSRNPDAFMLEAHQVSTVEDGSSLRSARHDRVLRGWAAALAVWSIAYVAPHVYWALGGTAGFSMLKPSAPALDDWHAINWAASAVLVVPALIAAALVRARPGHLKRGLLVACLGGAAIAAGHGLYGIVYRVLQIGGAVEVEGDSFDTARHGFVVWDLLVFEPWFLVEGILFAGAGWAACAPGSRRTWAIACAAAVALATVTGLLGLRV